jgi:hypothetical protein
MIAVISSLAAEYANARRRDFCLTMMAIGFPRRSAVFSAGCSPKARPLIID